MSNRVLLVAAIACGALATLVAFLYMGRQQPEREPVETTAIVIASHDLSANSTLNPDEDLTTLEVPRERFKRLAELTFQPESMGSLKGRQLNRPVPAKAPIFYADLVPVSDLKLSRNHRALSVSVSGANGLSGLVVPGDYVKLYVTRSAPSQEEESRSQTSELGQNPSQEQIAQMFADRLSQPGPRRWRSELISDEAFKVLAVGSHLAASRRQFGNYSRKQRGRLSYNSVTLEVTESQARTILERTGAGEATLTLLLCPAPDAAATQGES